MAKLKIGEGIQLEAQLPESKEIPKENTSRLDKVSNRVYENSEKAYECIQRTQALNERLKELGVSIGAVEEKVDDNHENILDLMNAFNDLDMKQPTIEKIIDPEIKSITIHRDHVKDFEEIYHKMSIDKDENRAKSRKAKIYVDDEIKKLKRNQTRINIVLGLALIGSVIINLF